MLTVFFTRFFAHVFSRSVSLMFEGPKHADIYGATRADGVRPDLALALGVVAWGGPGRWDGSGLGLGGAVARGPGLFRQLWLWPRRH